MSNKNLVMRRTRGLAGPFFQACRTGGLVHGVGNAYGLGGSLAGWSPLKLFAGGKLGAWYDPSDLSTLFQDSVGTIPVTADGQPVGKILDKSGNNNHAIQPTAGKRPTYRVASNAHWLDFDGVDDALYTATIDLSGTSKLTVFGGTANSKTLSTGTLIESSANYLNNGGSFALLTPSLATSHISFGTHGSAGAGEKETQNPPAGLLEKRVITAAQDFATTNDYGCDYIRVHQIPIANLIGSGNTAVGAGPLGNYPVYIGARNNGSNAASGNSLWGRIYSLIFVGEMYNTETLVLTEQWIDAKMVGTVYEPVWSWYAYQVTLGATATFTRASTAYVVDHQGLYKLAKSGESRYQGARRVENLVLDSDNLASASWVKTTGGTGSIPAIQSSAEIAPDGTNTAFRVLFNIGAGRTMSDTSSMAYNIMSVIKAARSRSVWIKSAVQGIGQIIRLRSSATYSGSPATTITAGDQWKRYCFSAGLVAVAQNGYDALEVMLRGDFATANTSDILLWHPQVEDTTNNPNGNYWVPSEYVPGGAKSGANVNAVEYFSHLCANTADVLGVVTEAQGAPISPTSINLLMEPASTNKIINSEAIDTWTPSVQVTFTANYAISPNGTTTADRITSTISSNDRAQRNQAHTAGVLYWIYSVFIKKDATATDYDSSINMLLTSGGTQISVSINFNLASMVRSGGTATVWGIEQVGQTDWYRVWVRLLDNGTANTIAALRIFPNVTNTTPKSITAWGGQLESFTTPPTGPTSYIPTTTVAVTRAVDALAYSGVPADNETRFVVNGANVDVDDWNGTYPTPTAPKLLNSINVYNPGERPS